MSFFFRNLPPPPPPPENGKRPHYYAHHTSRGVTPSSPSTFKLTWPRKTSLTSLGPGEGGHPSLSSRFFFALRVKYEV